MLHPHTSPDDPAIDLVDSLTPEMLERISSMTSEEATRWRLLLAQTGSGLLCRVFDVVRPSAQA